jgi:hypothetical protein
VLSLNNEIRVDGAYANKPQFCHHFKVSDASVGVGRFDNVVDEILNTTLGATSAIDNSRQPLNNNSTREDSVEASSANNNPDASNVSKVENETSLSSADTETSTVVNEKSSEQNVDIGVSKSNASILSSPSSEHSSLTATTDEEDDDAEEEGASHLASLPSKRRRIMEPDLPSTCTVLVSNKTGGKVYLVGTAHFSKESQVLMSWNFFLRH